MDLPLLATLLLVSAVVGSFVGTLVVRLPAHHPVVMDRSRCPACDTQLRVAELVPILSWLILRGRCRTCHQRIGTFYPLIEGAAIGVAFWAATVVTGWALWASCIFGWSLLALALIDWRHRLLPDELTLPLLPAGLGIAFLFDRQNLAAHALGAVSGFLSFAAIAAAYRSWRGREGLGGGDFKLFGGIGAWVGWDGLPSVVLIASISALGVSSLEWARGRRLSLRDEIPFGSYLSIAGWIVWLYGPLTLSR